jgi:N-acetylglutamate synthase-like GNAT family acetyltransferase
MNIKIFDNKKDFSEVELKELFSSCGWSSAKKPEVLVLAFHNASNVVCAYDANKLIGIIRSMDDGLWSSNIDCLLVHKDYQHKGIGTQLMNALLKKITNVEYINVCPDKRENAKFYKQFGFKVINGCYLQLKKNLRSYINGN